MHPPKVCSEGRRRLGVVTGAARGIGKAIAAELAARGDRLVLVDIDAETLAATHAEIAACGEVLASLPCDVGDARSVAAAHREIVGRHGNPQILINNAGIGGPFHRVDEVGDDEWDRLVNTNLRGVFLWSRAVLPGMKAAGHGRIVNIASVQGFLGASTSSTYVATKHGVLGYTRAIAAEWGAHGITCNAVCPGYVETALGAQDERVQGHRRKIVDRTPLGRLARPDEIAHLVEFLTAERSGFITGAAFVIDGGLTCHVGIG